MNITDIFIRKPDQPVGGSSGFGRQQLHRGGGTDQRGLGGT